MTRALLALALLAARPAAACKCAPDDVVRLLANPETAETALLGKVETLHAKKVFRVESSWTKRTPALAMPASSKCDLWPPAGKRLILLSVHPLDWFEKNKASPTICDSALLEPAKAGNAVSRLAAKTDFSNHFGYSPSWGYCQRDKDCVLSPGVCGGRDAVHARFKVEHDAWRDRIAPTVSCVVAVERADLKARCEENFCAAYPPAPQ